MKFLNTITKISIAALLLFTSAGAAEAASGSGGGGGGGGGGKGDRIVVIQSYPLEACPLPAETRADYVGILFCGLVRISNKPTEAFILADGFTNLPAGTTKTVFANVDVTLPCGNTATFSAFDQASFAQTLPPSPPFRMTTRSAAVRNTCV